MNKNKIFKISIFILIMISIFLLFTQNTFAMGRTVDNVIGSIPDNSPTSKRITEILSSVLAVVQAIGVGIAIIMLIVVGIKWVTSAPSGRAEILKSSKIYIIGAFFIFAAVGILQIIQNFAKIFDTTTTTP